MRTAVEKNQTWKKTGLWPEDAAGGMWGDDARGEGYTSTYEGPNTWGADISYYVEEVQTTNLPEVRTAYVVSWRSEMWHDEAERDAGGEIEYGEASVLYFDTYERAAVECRRQALKDESYVFLPTE